MARRSSRRTKRPRRRISKRRYATRRRRHRVVPQRRGNVSRTSDRLGHRRSKKSKLRAGIMANGSQTRFTNIAVVMEAPIVAGAFVAGEQTANCVLTLMDQATVGNIMNGLDLLNNPSAGAIAVLSTRQYIIGHCSGEIMITSSLQSVSTRLYYAWVTPRMNLTAGEDPVSMWNLGMSDEGAVGSNALMSDCIGCVPTDSILFKKGWRLETPVKEVYLGPGASEIIKFSKKWDMSFNKEQYNLWAAASQTLIKGFTSCLVCWGYGMPTNLLTIPGTGAVTCSTAPIKLLITGYFKFVNSFLDNNVKSFKVVADVIGAQPLYSTTAVDPLVGYADVGEPL